MAGEPRVEDNASATPFRWTAGRVSIMLTIVALVLWSYSITQARFEIGPYGLIGGLPVAFFVSLGVLTFASAILWVSKENHGGLLLLQLFLLIVSIWVVPIAIGGASLAEEKTYGDIGFIEYIVRTGHFDAADAWQHYWPAGWIFWAAALQTCGVSSDAIADLIPWLPFIWQCILSLPLFVFFRNTIGKDRANWCWAAMWLFYLACWHDTQNTGAQAFGVFYLFSLIALLTVSSTGKRTLRSTWHVFSAIVILAASAVAHLLGSVVTLAAATGLVASRRVRVPGLVLLGVLFIAVWTLYGAMSYFEWRVPHFLEMGFRIDEATGAGILNPLSGDESHATVALTRILFSGLILGLAVLGGILGWRLKNNRFADVTVLAIVAGCGLAAIAVGAGYRHELYQRFFVFLLPALAYFGVKLLQTRPTTVILVLVLLVALPFVFVAKYGNQRIDHLSAGYRSGAAFFQEKTSGGCIVGEFPIGRMANYERYRFLPSYEAYEDLQWEDGRPVLDIDCSLAPQYVCISNHDRVELAYYWNKPGLIDDVEDSLNSAADFHMVYASPEMSLYVHEPQ